MSTDGPEERHPCVACGEPIRGNASLCPQCGARQRPGWGPGRVAALAGAAITMLSLAFGTVKLVNVYRDWSAAERYVEERLAAAQTLSEARDFTSAWTAIEEAQQADPDSGRIRTMQADVAVRWLVDGQPVPVAWVWSKSASAPDPATTPGAAAERASPTLVVAEAFADDPGNAEIPALLAWARFLRSMEILAERRNFAADFEQALARDPASPLANLFLAHWWTVIEHDLGAALPYWQRALNDEEDLPRVRRFQIAALMRLADLRDEPRQEQDELVGRSLLAVLDEMRKGDEPIPAEFHTRSLVETYFEPRGDREWFSSLRSVRPLPDQLATLNWVEQSLGLSRYSEAPRQFQYIRARLLEEMSDYDNALEAYRAAAQSESGDRLSQRAEAAIERLTGAPSPDDLARDPWRRHQHHLRTQKPGESGFDEAVAAIIAHASIMLEIGDPSLSGRFPPVLEAAIASLSRWAEQPALSADARTRVLQELRELWVVRGLLRNRMTRFDGALSDLETVSVDPKTPLDLRSFTLANIAAVYADRSRWRDGSSEAGEALWQADIQEGFDRLTAAVSAGFDDWEWVERRLSPLRDHPEYAAFSIGHGRVPPRDDSEK